ncbi:MAG: GAF domain-containing protein [Deltaproteobacteria bacterium]|nr:GAF domain-containing protein [Deltaproteobacteria bacterium]
MSRTFWAAFLSLGYVFNLFALAYWTDWARRKGRSPVDNAWVYSLSLAVYCTSWTFYGSVGRAASQGAGFLPIYLGPTLVFLLAPVVLRRLVSFCRSEGVTCLPDLLEALYGKGQALGTLSTAILLAGVTPYVALQLKAVGYTFDLLTGRAPASGTLNDAAFWAALVLALFGALFGARTLVASERHEGMVAAVAFESAVKLVTFLLLGAYITWAIGGGLASVFGRALERADLSRLFTLGGSSGTPVSEWMSLSLLSAFAVVLLPRQFHMLVVENVREEHLTPSAWVFPGYLLLINLLVFPVALVGLLEKVGGSPDFFLISLPLSRGHTILAFLAYLGGFSAATSMVIVASVALSTMILHHFVSPLVLRRWAGRDLSVHLLHSKRVSILAVVLLGYAFKRWIGDSHTLVNIGLLSFAAVTQFAPSVFLGLYWKGASRAAALAGLLGGAAVWAYTLLLPSFAESGWVSMSLLRQGPWGLELLKPQELFGLKGLDPWTHALVWSAVFNLGLYLSVSLLRSGRSGGDLPVAASGAWISRDDLEDLLTRFVGASKAREVLGELPERALPQALLETAERCLASAVGTASTRMILRSYLAWPRDQAVEILDVFGGVTRTLAESREALERRLRELSVLHEASRTLSRSLDIDTVLREVLGLIQREFGFDHLAVRLLDSTGALRIRSHVGLHEDYVEASSVPPSRATHFGTCFLNGVPVIVEDARSSEGNPFFRMLSLRVPVTAFLHVPMFHEGRPIGVLAAYTTRGPMHFTDEFVGLFAGLANQLALAVVNAQLYAEVQAYSHAMEEKVRRRTAELEQANERLLELDRLKSDFLSTVSHELRTPLTSIRSFSEILLRYEVADEERKRRFVRIIHDEAERLSRMINDLLDLSKIEAGKLELTIEPQDLAGAVAQALDVTKPLFVEKGVDAAALVEPSLPPVLADRDRLRQILAKLLSNASKFSPEGGRIRIGCRRRGAYALVSVSDEGPGIPPGRLHEIFDRYTQVRDPQKDHPLGTGLGLSISRDLVEKLGGRIWVESKLGAGATFSFTLPLADDPALGGGEAADGAAREEAEAAG